MAATVGVESVTERCARIRAAVTLEQFFEKMDWEYPEPAERIRCKWPNHTDENPSMAVYEARQAVQCFACGKGGDLIELARCCAPSDGTPWRIEAALDWLESAFGLSNASSPAGFRQRMVQRLDRWKRKAAKPARDPKDVAEEEVTRAFDEVEFGVRSGDLAFGGSVKDYIWEVGDTHVDPFEWAAWARRMIYGTYATQLQLGRSVHQPAHVYDDRLESIRAHELWDAHRSDDLPPLDYLRHQVR